MKWVNGKVEEWRDILARILETWYTSLSVKIRVLWFHVNLEGGFYLIIESKNTYNLMFKQCSKLKNSKIGKSSVHWFLQSIFKHTLTHTLRANCVLKLNTQITAQSLINIKLTSASQAKDWCVGINLSSFECSKFHSLKFIEFSIILKFKFIGPSRITFKRYSVCITLCII